MGKQSEAKRNQEYVDKFDPPACGNCLHFLCDRDCPDWMKDSGHEYYLTESNKIEKNLRCGIGGFAAKKQGHCKLHSR